MNIMIRKNVVRNWPVLAAEGPNAELVGFLEGRARASPGPPKGLLNVIVIGQRLRQTTDRTSTNFRSEDSPPFPEETFRSIADRLSRNSRENEAGTQRRLQLLHADDGFVCITDDFSHRIG